MELIQIIYSILFYGGILLVVVISISFVISKNKQIVNNPHLDAKPTKKTKENIQQKTIRKNETVSYPKIYQINDPSSKEIKIVRKATVTKSEIQEKIRKEENQPRKTNGKRFTVVNEEIKERKSRFNAANFYL